MKLLVTGARGMLGSDFCLVLENSGHEAAAFARAEMDVSDLRRVRQVMESERPDCVIHTAAFTNVDESERNPDAAYTANTLGAWNVALACSEFDAVAVYVSTCGVFDGEKGAPYTEFDQPAPITHYHKSKYLGEELVAQHARRHFIVRPGWLFGGNVEHRRNFVEARRREALAKPEIVSAKDKFGSPTYTVDFARQVIELIRSEAYGTYHVANVGSASRYEYVREIVEQLGLPNAVRPVGSDFFPRSAPVPAWEALENTCLKARGMMIMRPWREALRDYVATRLSAEVHQ
ncbi:MAG: dTDP-4-dehydrorhamnose reductase [Acidobacteria bacterium]|nr:dTDP-4-dehydrorhamnose reductase [Acidobacteriota bacterium]